MTSLIDKEICLIDAGITSLTQVKVQFNTESVNLHCNLLKDIQHIDAMRYLKRLDLSSNQIKFMKGLDGMFLLESLNLACNEISVVQGLRDLR